MFRLNFSSKHVSQVWKFKNDITEILNEQFSNTTKRQPTLFPSKTTSLVLWNPLLCHDFHSKLIGYLLIQIYVSIKSYMHKKLKKNKQFWIRREKRLQWYDSSTSLFRFYLAKIFTGKSDQFNKDTCNKAYMYDFSSVLAVHRESSNASNYWKFNKLTTNLLVRSQY